MSAVDPAGQLMNKYSLDEFLDACGTTAPVRLTVERGQATDEYILPQPFVLVGADPRADLRLAEGPRRAAYLQVLGGRMLGVDLNGASGVHPGNHPPHRWIDPGQICRLGSVAIRFPADGASVPGTGQPSRRENPPAAELEIKSGSGSACRYRVKVPLVLIGKSSQCQVRLRDKSVSRFHCALVNTQAGLWAVDLLGRGGITVNGSACRAARLEDGDELRIGGFAFRPMLGTPKDLVRQEPDTGPFQIAALAAASSVAMPALPNGPAGADLAPLVSLFSALQQQMAEQFRLTMTGIVDSFRRMHDDQMRLIWEELAQIRRLNEEVASLRATQARLPAATVAARPLEAARRALEPGELRQAAADQPRGSSNGSPAAPNQGSSPRHPPANGVTPQANPIQPNPDVEKDVHGWVSRRVAQVQRERDGRWQRIMSFLTGTPS
jgi:FHA domain